MAPAPLHAGLLQRVGSLLVSGLPQDRILEELTGLVEALANTRLSEESRSAAQRLETLTAVAQTLSRESRLDQILQAISDRTAGAFDAALCSIMLLDEERGELVVRAVHGAPPESLRGSPLKVENSVAGRAVLTARPLYVPNVAVEPGSGDSGSGLASLLSVPLMVRETVRGTLNIYTREERAFSERDIDFATVVAAQAAVAIENDRLLAETEELRQALEARKLVERAKGILQQRFNLTEEEAYLRLRNESRRLRRPMRQLAEAVVLAEDLHRQSAAQETGEAS